MDLKELYPAFKAASEAMGSIYDPVFAAHAEKFHISRQEICILTSVPTFEPHPVSPDLLNTRSPYTSPDLYNSSLKRLAAADFLKPVAEDQYRITQHGLEVLKETLKAVYTSLAGIQSLSVTKMMDLASRLKELADACLEAADPPGIWCIQHVRRMDPGPGNPMMVRIDQFLSEIVAFREDAHLAAWRDYDCSGHAWDILTILWVEREGSLEGLNRALQRRGHSIDQTSEALDLLCYKEWVKTVKHRLHITPLGSDIRHTAELVTDRYFLEPFQHFSGIELEHTLDLVKQHRRGLIA